LGIRAGDRQLDGHVGQVHAGVVGVVAFAEAWKSLEAVRDAAASEVYRSFQKVEETVSRSTSPVPIATEER